MLTRYQQHQINLVGQYIEDSTNVLDFGCGDMGLIRGLLRRFPGKEFTGVDVVDTGERAEGAQFCLYDGKKLPFPGKTFDAAVVYHALHHCDNPNENLRDIVRVTKKRIIMIEPVVRSKWELPFMKLADRLGNGWRGVAIPMPFTFQMRDTWDTWAGKLGWKIEKEQRAGIFPALLPLGETVLFSLVRA